MDSAKSCDVHEPYPVRRLSGVVGGSYGRFSTDRGSTMILTFGKHKGLSIEEVDSDYLRWMLRGIPDLSPELRKAIERELDERVHRGVGTFEFGEE